MTTMENRSAALWTRGMIAVLSAQFLSYGLVFVGAT